MATMIEKAGDKKVCPICGSGLKKVTNNKGKGFVKCSKNGVFEEGVSTTCEFMIDTMPKVIEKEKDKELKQGDIIALLNGEKVKKGSGHFFINGIPDVHEGKKYYVKYEFNKAVVEDF